MGKFLGQIVDLEQIPLEFLQEVDSQQEYPSGANSLYEFPQRVKDQAIERWRTEGSSWILAHRVIPPEVHVMTAPIVNQTYTWSTGFQVQLLQIGTGAPGITMMDGTVFPIGSIFVHLGPGDKWKVTAANQATQVLEPKAPPPPPLPAPPPAPLPAPPTAPPAAAPPATAPSPPPVTPPTPTAADSPSGPHAAFAAIPAWGWLLMAGGLIWLATRD